MITKARKSIATYKLREGQPIGCKVTLRSTRMYEFLDRLIISRCRACAISAASIRRASTGAATTCIGIKEHIIFPEIDYDKATMIWGMDITVCTTREDRRRGARLARGLQFPVPAVRRRPSNADTQEMLMAKTSSIEKNKRRRRLPRSMRAVARG